MKKTILKLLLLFTCLVSLNHFTYGQDYNWKLCEGESAHSPKLDTIQVFDVNGYLILSVVVEKTEPSCPGSYDGSFKIVGALNNQDISNLRLQQFSHEEGFTSSNITLGKLYENKGKEDIIIAVTHNRRSIDLPEIVLGAFLSPISDVQIALDAELTNNESCPGANDGAIFLSQSRGDHRYPSNDSDIVWETGETGYERTGLAAGTYKFEYRKQFLGKWCCLPGAVTIGSNLCVTKVISENFNGDISSEIFIDPPGSVTFDNKQADFGTYGLLGFPFDSDSATTKAISVSFSLNSAGVGSIQIVDQDINVLATKEISGPGQMKSFINNPPAHGYFDLHAEAGSIIDDFCMFIFRDNISIPSHYKPGTSATSKRSNTAESYCIGDTIYPYNGFALSGGISPYSFRWSMDGDQIFDDADSLFHPISFTNEGNHNISLLVEDFVGQRDTLNFEYEAFISDSIKMSVPAYGLASSTFESLTLCLDDEPFQIDTEPSSATLSSESLGLSINTFSPAIAGPGIHIILASGDICDTYAGLIISVVPPSNSSITELPVVYNCAGDFDLNSLLTGDITGLWIVDDSIFLFNNNLPKDLLTIGDHTLSYSIGGGSCEYISSTTMKIIDFPIAVVNELTDTLLITDQPLDLNTILDSNSTLGGIWSGGDFVVDDTFDPSGLSPGVYTVTYSVGEGECLATASIDIVVAMNTSTTDLESGYKFKIYPNPVDDYLNLCLTSITIYDPYQATIYDIKGRVISKWASKKTCSQINISDLESGLYLLSLKNLKSSLTQTSRFIKK